MTPAEIKVAIIGAILGAAFGGAGITGIVFAYFRRFIDKRLDARDEVNKKHRERQVRRLSADDEWKHALGRLLFFIHKAIVTGQHNGDLEESWSAFQKAEEKHKTLDREIVVESEME